MWWQYLAGMMIVPVLLIGWLLVQNIGRRYARAHPELGEFREEGGGCGKSCSCSGNSCKKK
ncbi:MAG: chemotaxis protein [Gammaproteobacteria bacterium]|nr:chemotaxis protein [Gammaproteobacteria bacterium]